MENVEKIYIRLHLDTENQADYRKGCSRKSACALITVHIAHVLATKLGILKGLVSQSQRLLWTKLVLRVNLSRKTWMTIEESLEHFPRCLNGQCPNEK